MKYEKNEYYIALFAILFGAIVAIVLSPKNEYFFGNFLGYWGPQAIIIALLMVLRFRPAVISGCAIVLFIYFVCYWAWMQSLPAMEALAWLGYYFSLPGVIVGAIIAGIYSKYHLYDQIFKTILISVLLTFIGLLISQIIVCNTVIYCSLKQIF